MTEHKGYRIKPIVNLVGYELQHIGRGSIHSSLSGYFTSVDVARKAIDTYLLTKEGKEDVDGEIEASGGSKQIQRRTNYRRKPANNS